MPKLKILYFFLAKYLKANTSKVDEGWRTEEGSSLLVETLGRMWKYWGSGQPSCAFSTLLALAFKQNWQAQDLFFRFQPPCFQQLGLLKKETWPQTLEPFRFCEDFGEESYYLRLLWLRKTFNNLHLGLVSRYAFKECFISKIY